MNTSNKTMPEASQTSDLIPYRIAVRTATVAATFSIIVAALLLYDFMHRSMKSMKAPFQTAAQARSGLH